MRRAHRRRCSGGRRSPAAPPHPDRRPPAARDRLRRTTRWSTATRAASPSPPRPSWPRPCATCSCIAWPGAIPATAGRPTSGTARAEHQEALAAARADPPPPPDLRSVRAAGIAALAPRAAVHLDGPCAEHRSSLTRSAPRRHPAGLFASTAARRADAISSASSTADYTPSHDYDLIHQRIEVRNFDWDSTAFDGRVTTTRGRAARRVRCRACSTWSAQLEVRSGHRPAAASALTFDRPGDSLVVRLARPVACGDTVRFTVAYHGRITAGPRALLLQGRAGPAAPAAAGLQRRRHRRQPALDPHLGRRRTTRPPGSSIATVPARLTVVSNGRLVSDRPAPGGIAHDALGAGEAGVHLSHLASPRRRSSGSRDRWRGMPLDYYVYPRGQRARAAAVRRHART